MKRRIGIFWKYFIAYSATVTVVIVAFAILINSTISDWYYDVISDDLMKYALFAREAFRSSFENGSGDIQMLLEKLGNETGARITLIDTNGRILGDSEKDPSEMGDHSGRPEVRKALLGEIGTSIRYSTTLKEYMTYLAMPVMENGVIKGVVRISLKAQAIKPLIRRHTRIIVIISLVIWFFSLILTFLFSKIFSSYIKQMVSLTKRFAGGDLSKCAVIKGNDEISELSAGLNEMSQKLQSLFHQLHSQHDELNAIINSMTEGVLVLDPKLKIKLANESFKRMFYVEGNLEGKRYIEVVRSAILKEIIDELLQSGKVSERKMEFSGRILLANGIAFSGDNDIDGGFVLVFHDITSGDQMAKIKAEFVASASHELRTPLAVINGYLETFEDEDTETQKSIIRIIRRNVDRISNLVSDLLLLSRLESSMPQINMEMVILSEIADDMVKLVGRLAKDKGLDLKIDIPNDIKVYGDSFLLEQMLLNLLDNAIKYTEKGEVLLHARKENGKVAIRVSDTGVGITKEHLPRIFERFYRVDKAHSRDLGGTGLGLSIVKHIVQVHNGEVQVESQFDKGTTVTVYLPVIQGLEYSSENV